VPWLSIRSIRKRCGQRGVQLRQAGTCTIQPCYCGWNVGERSVAQHLGARHLAWRSGPAPVRRPADMDNPAALLEEHVPRLVALSATPVHERRLYEQDVDFLGLQPLASPSLYCCGACRDPVTVQPWESLLPCRCVSILRAKACGSPITDMCSQDILMPV
jgi:hypothetical protein